VQVEFGPQWVLHVPQCWAVLFATHMLPQESMPAPQVPHTPAAQVPGAGHT
jgi:hypothetical protein